jgi:hypothetical protein
VQISLVLLTNPTTTGPGSVVDLGVINSLHLSYAELTTNMTSSLQFCWMDFEVSVDNINWTSLGNVVQVNGPSSYVAAEFQGPNFPLWTPARYLRANVTNINGSFMLTATIVLNG